MFIQLSQASQVDPIDALDLVLIGHETGNGGDAVVCFDGDGQIDTVEMLDIYEAKTDNWGFSFKMGNAKDFNEKVQQSIDIFKQKVPQKGMLYQDYYDSFFSETSFKIVNLVDILDSKHVFFPIGCEVQQIAIHREPKFSGQSRYIINKKLWDKMDDLNKAALVLHEIIYRDSYENGNRNSVSSRYLNGWALSDQFSAVEPIKLEKFLEKFNFLESGTYPGLHFTTEKGSYETNTHYHSNGNIASAYLSEDKDSYIFYNNSKIVLKRGTHVNFHENGEIFSVISKNPLEFNFQNNIYRIVGYLRFDSNKKLLGGELVGPVEISLNSKKAIIQDKLYIHSNGKIANTSLAEYMEFDIAGRKVNGKDEIELYESGELKYLQNFQYERVELNTSYGSLLFRGKNFDRWGVYFFKSGLVRHGKMNGNPNLSISLNNKKVLISGDSTFSMHKDERTFSSIIALHDFDAKVLGQAGWFRIKASEKSDSYEEGTSISVDENGNIIKARLVYPQRFSIGNQSINLTEFDFERTYLYNVRLLEQESFFVDYKGQNIYFGDYTYDAMIYVYPNGLVSQAPVSPNHDLWLDVSGMKINVPNSTDCGNDLFNIVSCNEISFHQNGEISSLYSKNIVEFNVQGKKLNSIPYKYFLFYPTGSIMKAYISGIVELEDRNGNTIVCGQNNSNNQIGFDKNGKVIDCVGSHENFYPNLM
jgi:hypothetical protein